MPNRKKRFKTEAYNAAYSVQKLVVKNNKAGKVKIMSAHIHVCPIWLPCGYTGLPSKKLPKY